MPPATPSPPYSPQPHVLPPAGRRGTRLLGRRGSLFDDENLDTLAHVLDDCFHIPFTRIRFGIDGLIGLIPGLGDVAAGLASLALIVAAWFRGVPYVTLVRMSANVSVAVLVGVVPLFGDAFDVWWKPNRRNYRLLTRHLANPARRTWGDWLFLAMLMLTLLAILALPVVLVLFLVYEFGHLLVAR